MLEQFVTSTQRHRLQQAQQDFGKRGHGRIFAPVFPASSVASLLPISNHATSPLNERCLSPFPRRTHDRYGDLGQFPDGYYSNGYYKNTWLELEVISEERRTYSCYLQNRIPFGLTLY